MNITYFRVFTDEDTEQQVKISNSDRLANITFMAKKFSKIYIINFSIDKKNFYPITDSKGNPIIFSDSFESVLDLFYSHMDEYSHLTVNINEAFEEVRQNLKYEEKEQCN